jgi:hypothetical protein
LGFIVFWLIGLAVLGWKFWQTKSGYPGDIITFGQEKWGNWANWARFRPLGLCGKWRATELARLRGIHGKSPPRHGSRGVRAVLG